MDESGHKRPDMSSGLVLTDAHTFSQVFLRVSNGESLLGFTENTRARM